MPFKKGALWQLCNSEYHNLFILTVQTFEARFQQLNNISSLAQLYRILQVPHNSCYSCYSTFQLFSAVFSCFQLFSAVFSCYSCYSTFQTAAKRDFTNLNPITQMPFRPGSREPHTTKFEININLAEDIVVGVSEELADAGGHRLHRLALVVRVLIEDHRLRRGRRHAEHLAAAEQVVEAGRDAGGLRRGRRGGVLIGV